MLYLKILRSRTIQKFYPTWGEGVVYRKVDFVRLKELKHVTRKFLLRGH